MLPHALAYNQQAAPTAVAALSRALGGVPDPARELWELAGRLGAPRSLSELGMAEADPVGATGGRILATLAREMQRREVRYGLETMCIGGGQGLAAVFERVG